MTHPSLLKAHARGTITVSDLGKRFRIVSADRQRTLKAAVVARSHRQTERSFWGLRDVSFRVARGRTVGVVGRNGAGKSTLLRLIGGVGRPDEGTIEVHGRVGALLEISAGLTDDLTGRENVFLLGVIAGMTRREVEARFDEILAFSELEEFIDRPVRTYSTGMKMRLAFSVAVHIEPDILLVDEVLAVGDLAFQAKCFDRIREIQLKGCTIFLVSHDIDQIRDWCDEALFLKDGQVVAYGAAEQIIALFISSMEDTSAEPGAERPGAERDSAMLEQDRNRFGSRAVEITAVSLLDADGFEQHQFASGEALTVRVEYVSRQPAEDALLLVAIYASDGTICLEVDTQAAGIPFRALELPQAIDVRFDRLDLAGGHYFMTVGIFSEDWGVVLDYHAEAYPFTINSLRTSKGYLLPPMQWLKREGS